MNAYQRRSLRCFIATGALLLAVLGCSEDALSPTESGAAPALAAAATTAAFFHELSAGYYRTCGITDDDRAYCWGSNFDGELGDGTTTQRTRPQAVTGGHHFRNISTSGFGHTCGVASDFRAYCWGGNRVGQLGDGTTTGRVNPTPVAGGHRFRQIDTGEFFTCGVRYPDSRVFCWGGNWTGQLGDGTNTDRHTPVQVASDRQFRHVTVGEWHACGLTTAGEILCWGGNNVGQLGDGSEAEQRPTPTPVAGTRSYKQVDAGSFHTCAVASSGKAFCWGNGRVGQIGDGKTYLRFSPRRVAGELTFERVSAGGGHTCGETTTNQGYCWGANDQGQLGDGTRTQRLTPVPVTGGRFYSQVSTGSAHTCGRTPEAEAYCWGDNEFGQIGDGSKTDRVRPTAVASPS